MIPITLSSVIAGVNKPTLRIPGRGMTSVMTIFRHLSDFDSMSERNLDAKGCRF
jgi:hypothetical protein